VTVDYTTADGTATVADGDYVAKNGTLTFAPGVVRQTVSVPVVGTTVPEADETFTVNLSNATNATLLVAQGTGTIQNHQVSVTIGDATLSDDGDPGSSTHLVFPVTLSAAATFDVTVSWATAPGGSTTPATAGTDYLASSGTLTIPAGQTTGSIAVPVLGDVTNEPAKTFLVKMSGNVNAALARATATGTILSDDPVPTVSINSVTNTDGSSGTKAFVFTVTLSAPSGFTVTVPYSTADGSATVADGDYAAASGTLTFKPGVTSQTISITVHGDQIVESTETFTVNLGAPTNATVANGTGTGTIINDDGLAEFARSAAPSHHDHRRFGHPLTRAELNRAVDKAIAEWRHAGVKQSALARLRHVPISVAALPGNELGVTLNDHVKISADAAGWGWSLDGRPAHARMDLVTVVAHELGHVLGYGESSRPGDLMANTLPAGVRRVPRPTDVGLTTTIPSGRPASRLAELSQWPYRKSSPPLNRTR
jgi:hypothetical protein